MKFSASILLLVAASTSTCFAQSAPQAQNVAAPSVLPLPAARPTSLRGQDLSLFRMDQNGCPVVFASTSVYAPPRFLPVRATASSAKPSYLNLKFRNASGKEIESATLKAEVKVKKSIYDLDSAAASVYVTLWRVGTPGNDLTRSLPLPVLAYGVANVTLERVRYWDGSLWVRSRDKACSFPGPAATMQTTR